MVAGEFGYVSMKIVWIRRQAIQARRVVERIRLAPLTLMSRNTGPYSQFQGLKSRMMMLYTADTMPVHAMTWALVV